MTYEEFIKILTSDNAYNLVKENESEVFKLISELEKCKGFNQNNKWHIYDVYEHILQVIKNTENNKVLRLAALFHDIGKPLCYTEDDNNIGHFYNHWNESIKIFKNYQNKFSLTKEEIELITNLIFYHDLNVENLDQDEIDKMILNIGYQNMHLLFKLKRADLLAQSSNYHYLLENIDKQERMTVPNPNVYGKVVSAALLHNNTIYIGRKGHHEIFPMEPIGVLRSAKQGFVTENGYFIDRHLGLYLAKHYDQIEHKHNPLEVLVSEDLKKEHLKIKELKKNYSYKERDKQTGEVMKKYDKNKVLNEIVSILNFYKDKKECLLFANLLLNKVNRDDYVTLSKDEINEYLFYENGETNEVVFRCLKRLNADLTNVSFDYKIIRELNFDGLEGVKIDLDKVPNKDLTKTKFAGVELTGTLDNAILDGTDFENYIGDLSLNPQKVANKSIKGCTLAGLMLTGSLDDIEIQGVNFRNTKNTPIVNPQRVPKKELMGINFANVMLSASPTEFIQPSFEGCSVYDCIFKEMKEKIIIDLDELQGTFAPKLAICDLTDVTVIGNTKSHYDRVHCVNEDGTIRFENVKDDLFGSYYYDKDDNYVHIYLYESMLWDDKKKTWRYIPRSEEDKLQINVTFTEKEKSKQKFLSRFRKK